MYVFTMNVYSNTYAAWFKFIKDEFDLQSEIGGELDLWDNLYQSSGVYSAIFSELVCIVSKYPKKIHVDESKRIHNTNGVAVEWGALTDLTNFDGYYIHGRQIPKNVFEKCLSGQIKKEDYLNEKNDEIRSAIYEIMGDKMMDLLEAEEIDSVTIVHKNSETEKISIYRTKQKLNKHKNEPYAWIKRICPSTGTAYMTPTNPAFNKAIDAAKFHRPEFVPMSTDYLWHSRS